MKFATKIERGWKRKVKTICSFTCKVFVIVEIHSRNRDHSRNYGNQFRKLQKVSNTRQSKAHASQETVDTIVPTCGDNENQGALSSLPLDSAPFGPSSLSDRDVP